MRTGRGRATVTWEDVRARRPGEDLAMRALETIGFSLVVIAFSVATLLFMMGGLKYHREE